MLKSFKLDNEELNRYSMRKHYKVEFQKALGFEELK